MVNEYSAFLPGEREALVAPPKGSAMDEQGATASHSGAKLQGPASKVSMGGSRLQGTSYFE
jgi:hypothetical protein